MKLIAFGDALPKRMQAGSLAKSCCAEARRRIGGRGSGEHAGHKIETHNVGQNCPTLLVPCFGQFVRNG